MLKRTPLYQAHQRLGARLVEFGGWEMPIQYTGIIEEHLAVRTAAGLFDISHMGEFLIGGPGAGDWLNSVLTNDLNRLSPGQGQYTLLCNERGGVIDDLYAYRLGAASFLLIVNASRIDADREWLQSQLAGSDLQAAVRFEDASDRMGALAVQGPKVGGFIDRMVSGPSQEGAPAAAPTALVKNQVAAFPLRDTRVWVARTGYTGEDGFEIVAPADLIEGLWTLLLEDGRGAGLIACGLGARDTLRTEMGYPLYGHELDEQTTPVEAGLGMFVSFKKGPFVGREALLRQKEEGPARRCVAFQMTQRSAPPRPGYAILAADDDEAIGRVVSGTLSPSLHVGIGLGYVPSGLKEPGTPIRIDIRGRPCSAEIRSKPLYRKPA